MTVAVGLSPRWDSGKSQVAERRLKASRNQVLASTVAPRRKNLMDLNRGLKPTATITSSLREEGQRPRHLPTEIAKNMLWNYQDTEERWLAVNG